MRLEFKASIASIVPRQINSGPVAALACWIGKHQLSELKDILLEDFCTVEDPQTKVMVTMFRPRWLTIKTVDPEIREVMIYCESAVMGV